MAPYQNNYYQNRDNRFSTPGYTVIGADKVTDDYVDEAQKVIEAVRKDRNGMKLTTSQIRNLLSMTADIYNQAERLSQDTLTNDLVQKIEYLRIRFIYECGRTEAVKCLTTTGNILNKLKNIGKSKAEFVKFSHYMEALVAFHKYNGGND